MTKEVISTNDHDQYIVDPDKQATIKAWLRECEAGADALGSFCRFFPDDNLVQEYNATPNNLTVEMNLQFHMEIIASGIPISQYFDIHGLTDSMLMRELRALLEDEDHEMRFKALKLAFRLKRPTVKPLRINPTQNNYYNIGEESRDEIIDAIMDKIDAGRTK